MLLRVYVGPGAIIINFELFGLCVIANKHLADTYM